MIPARGCGDVMSTAFQLYRKQISCNLLQAKKSAPLLAVQVRYKSWTQLQAHLCMQTMCHMP
jgi:hypothetical protein